MAQLVCFDMDGVLFESRNFWMDLHKAYGTYEAGLEVTRKYLHSDYPRLVKEVVAGLWLNKDARKYHALVKSQKYTPGASLLFSHLKKEGFKTAIISGGPIDLAKRAQQDFGCDYIYANELVIKKGKISGEFNWPIGPGGMNKVELVKTACSLAGTTPKEAVFIGDSETDIDAFNCVGTAIAFNAENDKVRRAAKFVVDTRELKDVIPLIQKKGDF